MPSPGVVVRRSTPLKLEPDGRAPDWDSWVAWADKQTRPLAVDLFAGGGGLSLGLEDAGFRVALAADHDKWSVETHAANFQGLSVQMDLAEPAAEARLIGLLSQREIALVAGGPPCQPFSRAGRSAIRYLVGLGKRPARADGGRFLAARYVLGAICRPCSFSTRQIGSTPNWSRWMLM